MIVQWSQKWLKDIPWQLRKSVSKNRITPKSKGCSSCFQYNMLFGWCIYIIYISIVKYTRTLNTLLVDTQAHKYTHIILLFVVLIPLYPQWCPIYIYIYLVGGFNPSEKYWSNHQTYIYNIYIYNIYIALSWCFCDGFPILPPGSQHGPPTTSRRCCSPATWSRKAWRTTLRFPKSWGLPQ